MITGSIPDVVLRHAGLVMTHAAAIASVLEDGELICPFAVITKGENRQSIEFEASSQDEAVSQGWASLETYKEDFDLWAFARETRERQRALRSSPLSLKRCAQPARDALPQPRGARVPE